MLSGIVTIPPSCIRDPFPAEVLLRSLSALVPVAVNGTLGDLYIAAPKTVSGLEQIADQAGCMLVSGETAGQAFRTALEKLRYDSVLIQDMRFAAPPGFVLELDGLLQAGAKTMIMRSEASRLLARLWPRLAPAAVCVAARGDLQNMVRDANTDSLVADIARRLHNPRLFNARAIVLDNGT